MSEDSTGKFAESSEASAPLLLVDGHAYAYRSFFAIRNLRGADGTPKNAVYGFIKALAKLKCWLRPKLTIVVWDGGLAAERMELLPSYKSERPPMPEDLAAQLDEIVKYLEAAGVGSICHDGVEADDWIGAMAVKCAREGQRVIVASPDKDFMQLVDGLIGLVNPGDKVDRIWSEVEVIEKSGVKPNQIVDWLSLVGDSVDNIPGVRGVGSKTATNLLNAFGSIDGILANIGQIGSGRIRQEIVNSEQILRRNQKMIRLKTEMAITEKVCDIAGKLENRVKLAELYRQWGFKGMLKELAGGGLEQQALL